MKTRPVLAVTMGDPAGIGPEIIVKALADNRLRDICVPVVIGDVMVMEHAVSRIVKSPVQINTVEEPRKAQGIAGTMDVYPLKGLGLAHCIPGKLDAACGNGAFQAVKAAIELALAAKVDGTVTAPLNKEAMHLAGHHYDGHTEIYAKLTGTRSYSMMLADGKLRVAHVTTHMPLVKVSKALTVERILEVIRLGHEACCNLGIDKPRIGVSGFNPHAGENGIFGTEEQTTIGPAVSAAQKEGINATGPFPPDTVFCKAAGGGFDLVVAMYHDQGHIPLKMKSFIYDDTTGQWSGMTGVNVTLGLPIIRSSVDHGTAFENAGKNIASSRSMTNAIEFAAMLATGKKR
ncbi:MAG: 4-hydroxythreonine-4-phosphate dehydrogenase PdxA [Desulforhopalus sp.]